MSKNAKSEKNTKIQSQEFEPFNPHKFGMKLEKLIAKAGYKKNEFAEKCGIAETTAGKYYSGTNAPSVDTLLKMANVLGISVDDLISDDEADCKKKKPLMPNFDEITAQGIIEAVNYLISAYGLKSIQIEKKPRIIEDEYIGTIEVTDYISGFRIRDDVLSRYLEKVKDSENVMTALDEIGELEAYDRIIESWADIPNIDFDIKNRRLMWSDGLPF